MADFTIVEAPRRDRDVGDGPPQARSQETGPWLEADPLKRLQLALDNGFMANVTFRVRDEEFRCHSQIIGLASPRFAEMVANNEFQLSDMDPGHFKRILEIIYIGKLSTLPDVDQLLKIGYEALELQVHAAVAYCVTKLSEMVDDKNACQILDFANQIKNEELEKDCMRIIQTNACEVLSTDDILQCKHATLEKIVQQDELNQVSELKLFQTCVRWAETYTELGNPREALGSVIQCIRFRSISADDFSENVCSTGILTAEEERDILRCIATGKDHMMPTGFSKEICRKVFKTNIEKFILSNPKNIHSHNLTYSSLPFSVNKDSCFIGVEIMPDKTKEIHATGTISIIDKNGAVIASVSFIDTKSRFQVTFHRPRKMSANEVYTLSVTFSESRSRDYASVIKHIIMKSSTSSSLEIKILEGVLSPVHSLLIAEK